MHRVTVPCAPLSTLQCTEPPAGRPGRGATSATLHRLHCGQDMVAPLGLAGTGLRCAYDLRRRTWARAADCTRKRGTGVSGNGISGVGQRCKLWLPHGLQLPRRIAAPRYCPPPSEAYTNKPAPTHALAGSLGPFFLAAGIVGAQPLDLVMCTRYVAPKKWRRVQDGQPS